MPPTAWRTLKGNGLYPKLLIELFLKKWVVVGVGGVGVGSAAESQLTVMDTDRVS